MLLDTILVACLIGFFAMGARRGALTAATSVVSLLLAYGGGIFCAQAFAGAFAERLGVSELYAAAAAGTLGFVVTYLVSGLLGSLLRGWDRARIGDDPRSFVDRALGGCFGLLRGGLVVLLLSWLMIWLDAARDLGVIAGFERLPQTETSRVAGVTQSVVSQAVGRAMVENGESPEASARLMAQLAANPGPALSGLQDLLNDPKIMELQRDKLFWTLIENGASERALNRLSFYQVSHDDAMRARFVALGIVGPEALNDVEVFRDEARVVFDEVGPRLKGLREDPELQQLAENPEIVALLENGNTLALINRPEIQRLVDRISKR